MLPCRDGMGRSWAAARPAQAAAAGQGGGHAAVAPSPYKAVHPAGWRFPQTQGCLHTLQGERGSSGFAWLGVGGLRGACGRPSVRCRVRAGRGNHGLCALRAARPRSHECVSAALGPYRSGRRDASPPRSAARPGLELLVGCFGFRGQRGNGEQNTQRGLLRRLRVILPPRLRGAGCSVTAFGTAQSTGQPGQSDPGDFFPHLFCLQLLGCPRSQRWDPRTSVLPGHGHDPARTPGCGPAVPRARAQPLVALQSPRCPLRSRWHLSPLRSSGARRGCSTKPGTDTEPRA